MQILLLGLFVAVYLHDAATTVEHIGPDQTHRIAEALPGDAWPSLPLSVVLLIVLLPKLLVASTYWMACIHTRKRLGTRQGQRWLNWLEAATRAMPLLLATLFILDIWIGGLRHLRIPLQHTVLLDEALVMLPTLLTVVAGWLAYYPIDRRLREATILRAADAGQPVYPLLSRAGYLGMQLRHQFGLLLIPLSIVFGWSEAITLLGPNFDGPLSEMAVAWLGPLGVLIVFIAAPLIIRYIWQTTPLAPGPIRDRMAALCQSHHVRVRELLLWHTSGRMINAAVTGLVARVRYILLSDGLLDQLEPREVEAVMAHELAHVKCKHLTWLGAVVLTSLGLSEVAITTGIDALVAAYAGQTFDLHGPMGPAWFDLYDPQNRALLASIPAFAIALVLFGWVSRRIERQADVFAVRHLALVSDAPEHDIAGRQRFDTPSTQTMVHALQRVAELNHTSIHRKSWRHGSIAWRQDHLRSLAGQPLDRTPVDRTMNKIKLVTIAGMLLLAVLYMS